MQSNLQCNRCISSYVTPRSYLNLEHNLWKYHNSLKKMVCSLLVGGDWEANRWSRDNAAIGYVNPGVS